MSFLTIILIAFALAMDCFAISISIGVCSRAICIRRMLFVAIMFGLFQGLMPVIGWVSCVFVGSDTASWTKYIAGLLLLFVGAKMIYDSIISKKEEIEQCYHLSFMSVVMLSIATSLDALAVGASFGIMKYPIVEPVLIIGAVSFIMSIVGNIIGVTLGNKLGKKAEILGGVILIALAIKTIL